jgi:hypothetical protein
MLSVLWIVAAAAVVAGSGSGEVGSGEVGSGSGSMVDVEPEVTVEFRASGAVVDYDTARQDKIKKILADEAAVKPADVTLTITAGSVNIKAVIMLATAAAAIQAEANLMAKMSTAADATRFLADANVIVESVPTISSTVVASPPASPPVVHGSCASWCNPYTCGMGSCSGCSVCAKLSAGQYCAGWCNDWTSQMYYCGGCQPSYEKSIKCYSWCNSYTCDFADSCSGCNSCQALAAGQHCSSWCNYWTRWMQHCHGC